MTPPSDQDPHLSTTIGQAQRVAMRDLEVKYMDGGKRTISVPAPDPAPCATGGPILPPGVAPLATASLQVHANDAVQAVRDSIASGLITDDEIQSILQVVPRDQMRRLVYEYAGMGSALLMTLNKQVQLIDTVLSQLVAPDGSLRTVPEGFGMSLKDALNLSVKCSQLILRDLPKVYNVARVQRLEMAIGEVMEKHLTVEQQSEVLTRLEELTTDRGDA